MERPSVPAGRDLSINLLKLVEDLDAGVRFQLALALAESRDARAGHTLGRLAETGMQDIWLRTAVLSSATSHVPEILKVVLAMPPAALGREEMIVQLVATAAKSSPAQVLDQVLGLVLPEENQPVQTWHFTTLASLTAEAEKSLSKSTAAKARRVFAEARRMATDADQPEEGKEAAIRLLGFRGDQEQSQTVLVDLLKSPLSQRLQEATLASLRRNRNPQLLTGIWENWPRYAPSLRLALIDLLLSREEWASALLNEVEKGSVSLTEISPANRQRLLKHSKETIQQRAAKLFAGNRIEGRGEVLARYRSVSSLKGHAANGAIVFEKNCSSCHFFRGAGYAVGPDLAAFRDKRPEDFVVAVLDPNAAIEPRFINYQVETKDGRSLSGIVNGETATSLALVQGQGVTEKILRADIKELKASSVSLMPEGLEQTITPQDLADLIAYLKQQ